MRDYLILYICWPLFSRRQLLILKSVCTHYQLFLFIQVINPDSIGTLLVQFHAVVGVLTEDTDPMVSVMKLEKAPDETYADIGGLDQQIQEIKVTTRDWPYLRDLHYTFFTLLTISGRSQWSCRLLIQNTMKKWESNLQRGLSCMEPQELV